MFSSLSRYIDTISIAHTSKKSIKRVSTGLFRPVYKASGYAMSADIAAFLANVGTGPLERLEWNAWAIEDSALGTILAGESEIAPQKA